MKNILTFLILALFSAYTCAEDLNIAIDKAGKGFYINYIDVDILYVKQPTHELTVLDAPNLERIVFKYPAQVKFLKIGNAPKLTSLVSFAYLQNATVIFQSSNFTNKLYYETPFCLGLWLYQTANIVGKEIYEVCGY